MKHLFIAAAMLFSMTAFAQVGINNTSPKATLDITAKTTDGSRPEGLIIPQLSGNNIRTATTAGIYGTNQKGLIVYASSADSAPTSATASITAAGYYYFDGTNWQKISTGNTVSTTLASGNILVGNASNVATAVAPSGDVTISNTGVISIGAGKVTNSQMASAAALTVKGNATNAAASPTDISAGTDGYVLRRSGTTLGFGTVATAGIADGAVTAAKLNQMSASTGQVLSWNGTSWAPAPDATGVSTILGSGKIYVGNASSVATAVTPTGDVTIDNAGVTSIGAGKVTNTQMANSAALTVKGNATNASAAPTDIAAGTDGYVLRRSGTTLGFGTVATAGIADGAVTTNKILDATVANADLNTGVGGIYKGSGALSGGNTSVDLGTNNLSFTSSASTGTSHFTVDGTTLNVDAVNNRVGIGTNAPSAKLEINSGTVDTSGLKFTNLNSSTTVGNGQALGVDSSGNVITVPNSSASTITTSEAISSSGTFNVNDLGWTTITGSSQTITIPAGGKAVFLNFMVGIDYGGYPTGGGYAYYTTKLFVDNVATNVLQSAQESSPGAQAQFNLSSVKFLSAGSHTVDVRMMRTNNNGTTSGANMPCGTISMSFNASYIN